MKSIVVIGSSNTDMVVRVGHIPQAGETVLGGGFKQLAGGKGANQAVACARAGGDVWFVGRVGGDVFGAEALKGFEADGLHLDYVVTDAEQPSGVALIMVDDGGENVIAVASGANGALSVDDLAAARGVIEKAGVVLVQLESPMEVVEAAGAMAQECGVRFILNPAPAAQLPESLLKRVSVLTPNETEAELLSGVKVVDEATALAACETLVTLGVESVVITMGAKGSFLYCDEFKGLIEGIAVKAVDTVGAGDVFNGALAVGLAEGMGMVDAVRLGNAAGALSVMVEGAQASAPRRDMIEAKLRK